MEVKLDVLPIALHNFLVVQSVWHPLDTPYVRAPSMCLLKLCQKALSVCAGLDNTYEQPCVFRWPLSARLGSSIFSYLDSSRRSLLAKDWGSWGFRFLTLRHCKPSHVGSSSMT